MASNGQSDIGRAPGEVEGPIDHHGTDREKGGAEGEGLIRAEQVEDPSKETDGTPTTGAVSTGGQANGSNGKTCTCGASSRAGTGKDKLPFDFADTPPTNMVSVLLKPVMDEAQAASKRFKSRATLLNLALNVAIALQVILGALVTALSAVGVSGSGNAFSIGTVVLGTASTAVAGYVARARGTGEPDISVKREGDLDKFLRKCQAMIYDYEYDTKFLHLDPNMLYNTDLLTNIQARRDEFDAMSASWTTNATIGTNTA